MGELAEIATTIFCKGTPDLSPCVEESFFGSNRRKNDFYVEPERPVVKIMKIILHTISHIIEAASFCTKLNYVRIVDNSRLNTMPPRIRIR